jgi:hypothetical protein
MKDQSKLFFITRYLIVIDSAVWFGFAIMTAFGLHQGLPDGNLYRWVMAGMALTAGFLLLLFTYLSTRTRIAYFFLLGLLAAIAFLSVSDEVGLYDWISLAINLVALILLVLDRKRYLQ